MTDPILEVEDLGVVYHMGKRRLRALDAVGFQVRAGEVLGIVGESGCGKSTLSSAIMGLLPPNGEISDGQIRFQGQNLAELGAERYREVRGREIAMIFQDPLTSLNPTFTIATQMRDAQRAHRTHGRASARELHKRAVAMLEQVGIPDPERRIGAYPHEFSGGMRQRIMIATALLLEPALLIADEPTSALDVTLEAQILTLLLKLRREHGTALLFISHDLGVVSEVCDRVVVMYCGRAVEVGSAEQIFTTPRHPYTQALLEAFPSRDRRGEPLAAIPGRVPGLSDLPPGCTFSNRCPHAASACSEHKPGLLPLAGGQAVRCHLYDPASPHPDRSLVTAVGDADSGPQEVA